MSIYAYIPNEHTNSVSVLDIITNSVYTTLTVGNAPRGVAVTPDNKQVYVANASDGTISVIDIASNTVRTGAGYPITVGTFPYGVAISPNGRYAYITNLTASTISVIDTSTNTVSATITGLGSNPTGVDFTPDGSRAYVANTGSNTVSVIDTSTNTVKTGAGYPITVSSGALGVAISPDGAKVYVTNDKNAGVVSIITTSNDVVYKTLSLTAASGFTNTAPYGLAITPDGSKVYIVKQADDSIDVIDTSTDTIKTGAGYPIRFFSAPMCVAISPDGSKAYITGYANDEILVINTATDAISSTITIDANFGIIGFGKFIQQLSGEDDMGYLNKFRNGTFDIAQRGTSGTVTAGTTAYTLDGWQVTATGANIAWNQTYAGVFPADSIVLICTSGITGALIKQRIESSVCYPLAGQQVTVQWSIYNVTGASFTPTLTVKHANAVDNWSASTTDVSAVSLQSCSNSGVTTVCYTFTASSSSSNGLEVILDLGAALNHTTGVGIQLYIAKADIRLAPGVTTGLNNSPPIVESRPIEVELAYCQRYLAAFGDIAGSIGTGASSSTTASGYYIPFKVPLRVKPTGLSISTVGNLGVVSYAGTSVATLTGITFNSTNSSNEGAHVTTTVASGLTTSTPYMLSANTALAGNLLFTGAEL